MKPSLTVILRQNDPEAIKLLKASHTCLRNERIIKYMMLTLSFGVCLVAILNRYLLQIFPDWTNVEEVQTVAATYINLISGAIIVAGMPLSFFSSRMHTEGTVLQDRYEAYVFDNAPNQSILKPVSQTYITRYAHAVRKPDSKFTYNLYSPSAKVNEMTAQYEHIKREVYSDYDLYISIQPFFLTIWIGFCILVMAIAVSFNDMFVTTLINILIPSLSAITTICGSWHSYQLQMRQLTNLMTCIERIDAMSLERKRLYITSKENMRLLADGLYNYRSSAFVIPTFLVKIHNRTMDRQLADEEDMEKLSRSSISSTESPSTTTSTRSATTQTSPKSTSTSAAKTASTTHKTTSKTSSSSSSSKSKK